VIWATLGGVTIGLAILIQHMIEWYPGLARLKKKPVPYLAALLPFVYGWCYGALGTLTAIGLIGWSFDTALWATNWLGDALLWLGVGVEAGQVSHGATQPLTVFGNCVVFLLTVGTFALIKHTPAGTAVKRGTWSGLCLGTSSGVAGVAAVPLATAVNSLGETVYGAFA
jgi:hypothetical protein